MWARDSRAANWAGKPIAEILELDITEPANKAKIAKMLGKEVWGENSNRREQLQVTVGEKVATVDQFECC